ncbi:MAG: hypothetical protein AVDCRST_MAG30-1279, partial [uncultured Solirubrobacteraceae bacterium]
GPGRDRPGVRARGRPRGRVGVRRGADQPDLPAPTAL